MSGLPTPRTGKSATEQNTREGALKQNQVEGWRQELNGKINVYNDDIDSYLDTFVPARNKCTIVPPTDASLASKLVPQKGKEVANYGPLVRSPEPRRQRMSNASISTDRGIQRSPM